MGIVKGLRESLSIFKKDKWIFVFATIPILIGIILFAWMGTYLYTDLLGMGGDWIKEKVSKAEFAQFIVYLMGTILTVAYYFLISWTFTLIVSVVAAPFNDILSRRVEKAYLGQEAESIGDSLSRVGRNFFSVIYNELKKIGFILTLTIIAFFLSFIPLLTPISAILSAILMAVSFLDYSWSRKGVAFSSCLNDIRKSVFVYMLSGFLFLFLVSVPVVNLFVIPLGVIYFTIMHTSRSINA